MSKFAIAAAALAGLAVVSSLPAPGGDAPAQPFWELQGAGPGFRDSAAAAALRIVAREERTPHAVVAAR